MPRKKKILVVSHDETSRVFVSELLRSHPDYEILTVEDEVKGFERALRQSPDLIILDMMMPRIDGYNVGRMLRANNDGQIPMIMLAPQGRAVPAELSPIEEVLATPFDPMALLSRVDAVLRRSPLFAAANPLIHLSSYPNIGQQLAQYAKFAVGYADLDNLSVFNKQYGFTQGDLMIGHTKQIITQTVRTFGTPHDFMKHLNGDDFVFVTVPERMDAICRQIITEFDREVQQTYTPQSSAYTRFSPISISIAVVTNLEHHFTDFAEIGEIAMELRRYLKTLPGSNYYINRRSRR